VILDDVHRGIRKKKQRKRVGRGPGSGHGKTAGRGHKGYGSRSGAKRRRGFQGGQMPLFRRMAKRGFNNKAFADVVAIINVATLEEVFKKGDTVDLVSLRDKGLAKGRFDLLKILGQGELKKSLTVVADRFSKSAVEKIEAAGGTVQVVGAE
jgi:large subunit ribosomal protein L15